MQKDIQKQSECLKSVGGDMFKDGSIYKDKISIIVPIYKVEKYLSKCVESILVQTYTNIEIILVDDGSPDQCGEFCDKYARHDSRIKVIHKENGGLSDARNVGIEAATGTYIAFVDSDDYIHPQMIEKLYEAIYRNNADMSICNFEYVYSDMICKDNCENSPIKDEVITGKEILIHKLMGSGMWYWVVAWNKLYRKTLFKSIRFPNGKIHEDEFIIHKICGECNRVVCVPDVLYFYVQRKGSITSEKFDIKRLDRAEAELDRCFYLININANNNIVYKTLILALNDIQKGYEYYSISIYNKMRRCRELRKESIRIAKYLLQSDLSTKFKCRLIIEIVSPYIAWKTKELLRKGRKKS